ncbi:hypothetical protein R1sor_027484 [Riccia sorocarpa]|uniref:CCHC-type domain-containing protein n=1 Tax=Riccia sorocarpa TaxID=122646 RepID=A0ABD3GG12_9MARC
MSMSLGERIRASLEQALTKGKGEDSQDGGTGASSSSGAILSNRGVESAQATRISNSGKNVAAAQSQSQSSSSRGGPATGNATEEIHFPPLVSTATPERNRSVDNANLELSVDPNWGVKVQDDELQRVIEEINRIASLGDFSDAKILTLDEEDHRILKVRLDQLRTASLILQTPDSLPTRDALETWLEWSVVQEFKVTLAQLRVLGRGIFLLVLTNQDERDRLLKESPLDFDGFPAILSPWTPDYNPRHARVQRVATWVELPMVDPLIEPLCDKMLAQIGQLTFRTMTRGHNKYPNVRGCVMVEEGREKPTKLAFQCAWGGMIVQEVKYQDVPNACFRCKNTGHMAKDCPNAAVNGNWRTPHDQNRTNGRWNKPRIITLSEIHGDSGEPSPTGNARNNNFIEVKPSRSGRKPSQKMDSPVEQERPILETVGDQGRNETQVDPEDALMTSDDFTRREMGLETVLSPIGNWADAVEIEMGGQSTRGTKGRGEEDPNHTPDRGNKSKKRTPIPGYQKVESFTELGVQKEARERAEKLASTVQTLNWALGLGEPPDGVGGISRRTLFPTTGGGRGKEKGGNPHEGGAAQPRMNAGDGQAGGVSMESQPQHKTNFSTYTCPGT